MAFSDEQLLAGGPQAFGDFYARHERAVFRYFYRRVRDAEVAADLTAECFAAALLAAHRFRGREGSPAVAWLFGIARNVLRRSAEQRRVESRARAKLGMPPLVLEDETLAALDRIHAGRLLDDALTYLPADQAEAVRARIVDEREYEDIARELRASEAVVRKRVSRGLSALRRHVEDRA
ncbi:RNA polymerase sigma factor [Solirubrobacter sp. CPCC 204708]|uniref:RNA polymerase sigma factor n=1 Tax=Solirubrobacter deserti TaxID=2282478 RepID=A0ABT4RGB1_9ACTN|nr:RNA polymerase sigma factor [Solirubrobacter deserti]MBE2319692.1 RNA polymerase sigma factor [Solirubrobacter deserti]MDA0137569.1 RNA polymerase sigma factor [Solirubrobacter deserti]